MTLLYLESLPPKTTKGTVVRLLTQVGEIDRQRIGTIEIRGRSAAVEVPSKWAARLVKALDGTPLAHGHIRARIDESAAEVAGRPQGDADRHFDQLLRLMEIEAEAEAQAAAAAMQKMAAGEAERAGNTLIDLEVRDEQAGLGGRIVVTLAKRSKSPLPWTRLGVGSPVVLTEQDIKPVTANKARAASTTGQQRGVICGRAETTVDVAINQPLAPPEQDGVYRLDLSSDETARLRQRSALQRARDAAGDRLAMFRKLLVEDQAPRFAKPAPLELQDPALNESQAEAVQFVMSAEDVAMIHGPPGTGKTTTVVECIRQAVRRGQKVLACAPSNLAVDNIFERLLAGGEKAVRLGHPARVLPNLREHTLDLMVANHGDMRLVRKLTREAFQKFRQAARFTRAKPAPGEKREMRDEARALLADARRVEAQVVQSILDDADVLCATLTGLDSEVLGQRQFDLAVIDEACQSTEPACWIPLLRCERLLLAGDHCQLPPTVVSRDAAAAGFGVSLFERLMGTAGEQVSRQLTVQYRMHESIMTFSSDHFYQSTLSAHHSVASHRLDDLPHVVASAVGELPIEFIDTAGAGFDEQLEPDGESRLNLGEAKLVCRKARELLDAGLPPSDFAVIAPYAAQVRVLREMLSVPGLEIDTVDGFQGREKEAILITLVRSNSSGEIGFLGDVRRMNVALTRARRKLLVIGDSATIGRHPFYQALLEYFEAQAAYRTVWEEGDLG